MVASPKDPHESAPRRWLILPDQLDRDAWLARLAAGTDARAGALLVESREWLSRRPYHRQRVAIILLNLRAFADELRAAGVDVRLLRTERPIAEAVRSEVTDVGPLDVLEPAEREMRAELSGMIESGDLRVHPNPQWITRDSDFAAAKGREGWRMDAFYRAVRRRTGLLMEDGQPVGGKLSFDVDNRARWDGIPAAPEPPRFARTPLRDAVEREVTSVYAAHPGRLDVEALPATHDDTRVLWQWGVRACLPHFGPFEDAMSERSRGLFHTRISPSLNLGRIAPATLVSDACASGAPIQSVEGFVRQVIGWREFVRHVHRATDGFRTVPSGASPVLPRPGDAGYARWAGRAWVPAGEAPPGVDGGAAPSHFGEERTPLPPAYWGATSGLRCLDHAVESVWDEGWSHHITRLMVLGNLATLLDVDARELTDWFWVAYMDAWDWVVEPNVLGMATYAAGGVMTTKPYVAGSAYIERMSDHCDACAFTPGGTCPITRLYWAFLARHEPTLRANPRLKLVMGSLRRRSAEDRERDREAFVHVRDVLVRGERLQPAAAARRGR